MRYSILLVFALVGLLSCKYEPKGDYVSPIQPPTGTDGKVVLSPATDVITLVAATTFSFTVTPTGKGQYHAVITYDGAAVLNTDSQTGTFVFRLSPVGHPTQGKLNIEITYLSKSASIAGQLGLETVTFQQEWKVMLDTTLPTAIPAPTVAIEDGRLMIRWQAPSRFNFTRLIVLRTYANGRRDSLKVADIHNTSLEDVTYVGGDVTYRVDMNGIFYQVGSTAAFTCAPVTVSLNAQTGIFSWPVPLLYNNQNLRMTVSSTDYQLNGSSTYNPFVRFGDFQQISFTIRPVVSDGGTPPYTNQFIKKAMVGIEIPKFQEAAYNASGNCWLLRDGTKLLKFNSTLDLTNAQSVASSLSGPLLLSRDDQYAYTADASSFFRFNSNNLSLVETTSFTSLIGSNQGISMAPTLTSGNLIAANFSGAAFRSYVFDMNSKTILFQSSAPDYICISPDGNFLVQGTNVYSRGAGNWNVLLGTLPASELLENLQFRQDGINRLYGRGGSSGNIYVVDLDAAPNAGNELQYSVPSFPPNLGFSYDHHSNTLVLRTGDNYSSSGELHLIDGTTLTERKVIPNISWYNDSRIFCFNDNLLHQLGFFLPKVN